AMKILIGVDDSPHTRATVDFVKSMRWPENAQFLVLSAVQPIMSVYAESYVPAAMPDYHQLLRDMTKMSEDVVSGAGQELRAAGFRTTAKVVHGDPRSTLLDTVKSEGIDLLVVGSHGRTGMTKLIMGSVASHVVTHAPCSVLVVKTRKPPL